MLKISWKSAAAYLDGPIKKLTDSKHDFFERLFSHQLKRVESKLLWVKPGPVSQSFSLIKTASTKRQPSNSFSKNSPRRASSPGLNCREPKFRPRPVPHLAIYIYLSEHNWQMARFSLLDWTSEERPPKISKMALVLDPGPFLRAMHQINECLLILKNDEPNNWSNVISFRL